MRADIIPPSDFSHLENLFSCHVSPHHGDTESVKVTTLVNILIMEFHSGWRILRPFNSFVPQTDVFMTTRTTILHKIHRTNRWFYDINHRNHMPVFHPPIKNTHNSTNTIPSPAPLFLMLFYCFVLPFTLGSPLMVTGYHLAKCCSSNPVVMCGCVRHITFPPHQSVTSPLAAPPTSTKE